VSKELGTPRAWSPDQVFIKMAMRQREATEALRSLQPHSLRACHSEVVLLLLTNNTTSVKPAGPGLTAANLKRVSSSRQRSCAAVPKLGTVVSGEASVYPSRPERTDLKQAVTSYPNPSQILSATAANSGNDNRPRRLPRDMFFVGGIVRACLHNRTLMHHQAPQIKR
jgi:hypothetical protein